MDTKAINAFLSSVELFQDLDNEELDQITALIEIKQHKPDSVLFSENTRRKNIFIIVEGEVQLYKEDSFGSIRNLVIFGNGDFFGENVLMDETSYSTSAKTLSDATILILDGHSLRGDFESYGRIMIKMTRCISRVMVRRMLIANKHIDSVASQYITGNTRTEYDLLGEREIPNEVYYGVQTLRAIENFNVSGVKLSFYPLLINAFAMVKMAAIKANHELGHIPDDVKDAVVQACHEIMNGNFDYAFPVETKENLALALQDISGGVTVPVLIEGLAEARE